MADPPIGAQPAAAGPTPDPDIGAGAQAPVMLGGLAAVALCCCMYRCANWCCCGCVYRCAKWCCGCVYRCAKWCCCACVYRCAKWCCCVCVYRSAKWCCCVCVWCCCVCVYRSAKWCCCVCVYRSAKWCCCVCVYRSAKWCCSCVYRCAKWCCCPVATDAQELEMEADRGRRQTPNERQFTEVPDHVMRDTTIDKFLQEMANEQPIRFTAEQLAGFTRNCSAPLGRGGFGTVYRGALPNGLAVAVKVLHGGLDQKTSEQQFMTEMGTIGRTHHINLVRLYGFCSHAATARHALVYEFMEHGALGDYLSARGAGVSMATVAAIATGVARGLRYLHEECKPKILHLDIKPGNVLLDGSLTPKVADFGLARLLNLADTHISVSSPRGTPGYAAPEVWLDFELRLTEKCDVYSFGILLLDIIRRGRNLEDMESESSQRWFPMMAWTRYEAGELMELVVPTAGRPGEDEARRCRELVERMCKVAFWCAQRQPPARPSMSSVVKMLEGEMNIAPPPNPFRYFDAPALAASLRI